MAWGWCTEQGNPETCLGGSRQCPWKVVYTWNFVPRKQTVLGKYILSSFESEQLSFFFFNSRSQGRAEKLALGFHSAPCIVCSQLSYQGWRLSYFFAVGEWRGSHSMTTAAALWSAYSELVYMHSTHIACIWPRCMTCTPHVSHASLHKISTTRTGVNFVLSKLGETKLMVASSVFGGLDPKAFT